VEFVIDITAQKRLQQQKDEFIAIASHELKTPVTSLKVYAEVLQEKFEQSKETAHASLMQKLIRQVDRLNDLINDLLDTTRIAEGRLSFRFESFDLNVLIEDFVEELQRISKQHRIVFKKGKIQTITADKERIGQVLSNLIFNAIKYSPGGGDINIHSEEVEKGVKVSIADKGIGIPEKQLKSIFSRFYRVDNPSIRTFPGMGLGLYISAVIIERHGGTIHVESKEGEGSVFSFIIPYGSE
jgi:signal transduction histidine kinase